MRHTEQPTAYDQLVRDEFSPLYRVYKLQALTHTISLALQVEDLTTMQLNYIQDAVEYVAEAAE